MSDQAVADLAREAGLQVTWEDASGAPKTVSTDSLRVILTAMGLPCDTQAAIADSGKRLKADQASAATTFLTATIGEPVKLEQSATAARLILEDGGVLDLALTPTTTGARFTAPDTPGYHQLEIGGHRRTLAVAPRRCFTMQDASPGRRLWGAAVQVYSLRDHRREAFGDFGALASFAAEIGRRGAQALAISPVHALFAADASRYSPYAPSTRLFLNGLYADPGAALGSESEVPEGDAGGELIDYATAIPARLEHFRKRFERFKANGDAALHADFGRFRDEGGADLERHARFEALHAHFFHASGARGWQDWPEAFHDPHSEAVADFARDQDDDVQFHIFLQWLADRSLAHAQQAATEAGMAVGLIADLAVGMDAGGSHAWSRRGDLLNGLSVGAPPDVFQPAGQDWGIAAFSPLALRRTGFDAFLATIRSAMKHAGGVRIDHAMGLRRLWLTPHGASAKDGAYLSYPFKDMLRLIALESHRAKAIVVGEDLGTVPDGFREATTDAAVMGMRVLWFERDAKTEVFTPPTEWDQEALALTTTHDLPTVAGWWCGRDIDWKVKLNRKGRYADEAEERKARTADRELLWRACVEAGVAEGPAPPTDQPDKAVDAVLALVAKTPCELAIIPVEDLLALPEQPNEPGTIDEHPNWRRRLPAAPDILFQADEVSARLRALSLERPA
ncbi:MAG: 4-alpha-glucanotransferase [Caulobacteraceae bacterium]